MLGGRQRPQPGSEWRGGHHLLRDDRLARGDGDRAGSPVPDKFRSIPGAVFPVYHVLADIGEFAGGEVLAGRPSDALAVDGIALRKDDRLRVLIANMTAEPQTVTVPGLHGRIDLRLLDASVAEEAMRAPEAFRARSGTTVEAAAGLEIKLPPYAVARLDGKQA